MNRILILISVILLVTLVVVELIPRNSPGEIVGYRDSIQEQRVQKDEYMKQDMNSPFVAQHETFHGLKYFKIDPDFRVKGNVVPFPGRETMRMKMSDGTSEAFFRYAAVNFYLSGEPQHLAMYKPVEDSGSDDYFLPFYDETSTFSTYGGGRYLNVKYRGGPEAVLDFNLAYNPYCAYVEGYACPLPPPGNRITVKVEAGEKKYKD